MNLQSTTPRVTALALCLAACEPSGPSDATAASAAASTAVSVSTSASATPKPSASASAAAPPSRVCALKWKTLKTIGFSPDEKTLLTSGPTPKSATESGGEMTPDGAVDLWDLSQGKRRASLDLGPPGPAGHAPVVGFSSDSKWALLAGNYDAAGPVALWDLTSGATRASKDYLAFPLSIEFTPDGTMALVAGGAQQVVTYDLPTMKANGPSAYSEGHSEAHAVFAPDGKTFVRVNPSVMEIRDSKSLKVLKELGTGNVSPKGDIVVVSTKKGMVVAEAATGKKLVALEGAAPIEVNSSARVEFTKDGSKVVMQSPGSMDLKWWDIATGKVLGSAPMGDDFGGGFTPDGKFIVVNKKIFDASDGKPIGAGKTVAYWTGPHSYAYRNGAKLAELDASTAKETGRAFDVPEGSYDVSVSGQYRFIAFSVEGSNSVELIRLADGARLHLGAVFEGNDTHWLTWADDGAFDGSKPAHGCVPAPKSGQLHEQAELLKTFVEKK